jgi:hypothetical protein
LAIVLRRESLLPLNEPAQANDWHLTVPAKDRLTSDFTRSVEQAASPQTTETATAHANTCLIMAKTSGDHLERGATQ